MGFRTLQKKLKEFQALYNLVIAHYGQNKNVSKKQKKARAKHVVRVMKKTQELTQKAQWPSEDIRLAVAAACVHDVAKFDEDEKKPSHDELGKEWVRQNRSKICECMKIGRYDTLFQFAIQYSGIKIFVLRKMKTTRLGIQTDSLN